ncbi:hypothetical protein J421_0042 [Gemmatirosa kalamazoonensis]|uniref:Uncharacterized protein n=1 Tax=Gemmatirosa kalamazoonensis TaxID=861299 RepID=W0RDU7_9BACT|nr:hypothetical protein [Gemmatirosa kalamazoonensis]AHG87558.1 hypothetical protein J421_0020 [Gemmatirosa kalamazoonensis]AHG87579.1 hypothetical protein J421_0042 [Gemmatirosa kalamazoonensis]
MARRTEGSRVTPRQRPRLLGALALWRRELAAGTRTMATEDALAQAARCEATALECFADGDQATAQRMLERAAARLIQHRAAVREAIGRPA